MISSASAFLINDLKCAYQGKEIVLSIDTLSIPSSGMIFVVGPSGSGKSTLLETLGLMNNTIMNPGEASITFQPGMDVKHEDIIGAWTKSEDYRAELRSRSFSFLFQHTNLMPHFTAGENMCTSLLIQGLSFASAKEKVLDVMRMLDLDRRLFDRKTSELSGGQRQRLAFVRAFTGQHSVLFGDEPTGNLDAGTARKLMDILQAQMQASRSVCIVVSHDLDLAHQYADLIIPIRFVHSDINSTHRYGFVTQKHIYVRDQSHWRNHAEDRIENLRSRLSELITARSTSTLLA